MRPTWKLVLISAASLWIAAVCEQCLANRMLLLGQRPDFLLATMTPLALCLAGTGPIWIGFLAGLLQGGISGANLVHYVISRTLSGYGLVLFRGLELDTGVIIVVIATALVTVLSQLLLMLLAPPPALTPFLAATIGTAVYNGVLAFPIYAVLRKLLRVRPGA